MARKTATIVATVEKVDQYSAYARSKLKDGEPFLEDEVLWGIPKELGAAVNDDVVITMTADLQKFISYRLARKKRGIRA